MTKRATISEPELRRMAKIAKSEGVSIRLVVDGVAIEIRDEPKPVDARMEIVL